MLDTPHIEVIDLELLQNASALKATATILYDATTVYQVRVLHPAGKAPFVAPPQREYWDSQGVRRFTPLVRWEWALAEAITDAVIAAYAQALQVATSWGARAPVPPCFAVLGVAPPCTPEDVKQAYREQARRTHPDAGGNPQDFIKVSEAYDQALRLVGGAR